MMGFVAPYILSQPGTAQFGFEWHGRDVLAMVLLVGGAFAGAWRRLPRVAVLGYGAIGALGFLPTLMPDSRDYLSIGRVGMSSFWPWVIRICTVIAVSAILCYIAGSLRRALDQRLLSSRQPERCTQCGYLLYGLTESRCPECGQRFAHVVPSQPSETPPSPP